MPRHWTKAGAPPPVGVVGTNVGDHGTQLVGVERHGGWSRGVLSEPQRPPTCGGYLGARVKFTQQFCAPGEGQGRGGEQCLAGRRGDGSYTQAAPGQRMDGARRAAPDRAHHGRGTAAGAEQRDARAAGPRAVRQRRPILPELVLDRTSQTFCARSPIYHPVVKRTTRAHRAHTATSATTLTGSDALCFRLL